MDLAQNKNLVYNKIVSIYCLVLSDSLIIHFHGGGFVAQTASSHMKHLSKWAKDTGAPIVTVDYRLAPGIG